MHVPLWNVVHGYRLTMIIAEIELRQIAVKYCFLDEGFGVGCPHILALCLPPPDVTIANSDFTANLPELSSKR
jgi:hypothetical protein